jgi:hypothetical protein
MVTNPTTGRHEKNLPNRNHAAMLLKYCCATLPQKFRLRPMFIYQLSLSAGKYQMRGAIQYE